MSLLDLLIVFTGNPYESPFSKEVRQFVRAIEVHLEGSIWVRARIDDDGPPFSPRVGVDEGVAPLKLAATDVCDSALGTPERPILKHQKCLVR